MSVLYGKVFFFIISKLCILDNVKELRLFSICFAFCRLYVKKKYDGEEWFKDKFLSEQISVKDALRLTITTSLERLLVLIYFLQQFIVNPH